MSQLYFFSLRDIKYNKKAKYTGLIPKLFNDMYNNPSLHIKGLFNYDKLFHMKKTKHSQNETFKKQELQLCKI